MTVVKGGIPMREFVFIVLHEKLNVMNVRRHGYVSDYGASVDPSHNYCTTTRLVRQVKEHLRHHDERGVFLGHHPALVHFSDGFFSGRRAVSLGNKVPDELLHTANLMTQFGHEVSPGFEFRGRLDHLDMLFDLLFDDHSKGLLSLREWSPTTLFERFSRIDSDPQTVLGRCLLSALEKHPEYPTPCGYRAGHYLLGALTRHGTFSDAAVREAHEHVERHNALVERGYPDTWAYKTVHCREGLENLPVPDHLTSPE